MNAKIRATEDGRIEVTMDGYEPTLVGDHIEVEHAPTQAGALIWVDTDEGMHVLYVGDEPVDAPLVRYIAKRDGRLGGEPQPR